MDLSLLETLRNKIATSKDFANVFEYFFDHFAEEPEFFNLGKPDEDDLLLKLLSHVGGAIFKTDRVTLRDLRLICIAEYHFIHGGMTINGAMANVIYCADLQQGILVVHRPGKSTPMQFARFSAEMLPPTLVTEASKFKH